ncbi:hypothetical protein [Acrocarpospora sp. B8E8]|uniref:hypothetical protein n=1 Tax=Acrocarpospora sp. B8E8 TaxID=3153572 RepID=UPI00325DB75D
MSTVLTVDEVEAWQGPPLILFVGISTGGSLVHRVFGRWAALLDQPWTLRGVDLPAGTPPAGCPPSSTCIPPSTLNSISAPFERPRLRTVSVTQNLESHRPWNSVRISY